jgi:hypothetical protein
MTTGRDIVTSALQDAGIVGQGQTPSANDVNEAVRRLNWLIAQWRRKRWLIPYLEDLSYNPTGSADYYTVGPQGNFNISARPDKIEAAYLRQINIAAAAQRPDYPLRVLQSRTDYARITLKQLQSFSECVYYSPEVPLGKLYIWPIPTANIYQVHILVKMVLETVTLNTTLVLPDEWSAAMNFCLAQRLRAAWRMPPDENLNGLARDALNVLRVANFQIGQLVMPGSLVRPGLYNVYSDQTY